MESKCKKIKLFSELFNFSLGNLLSTTRLQLIPNLLAIFMLLQIPPKVILISVCLIFDFFYLYLLLYNQKKVRQMINCIIHFNILESQLIPV